MDCLDVERALLAGEPVRGPALETHLATCATCRFLVEDGAPVARGLEGARGAAAPAPADLTALEAAVLGELAGEEGLAATAREASRPARLLAVAALATAESIFMFAVLRRADWEAYPAWRMAAVLALYGVALLWLGWLGLRPLYRPPLPARVERLLLGTALLLPFVIAVLPAVPTEPGRSLAHAGFAFSCFAGGSAMALTVVLLARMLDRGRHAHRFAALASAVAGGFVGIIGVQIECPVNLPVHLLTSHATVPLGLALGYALFRRARRGLGVRGA